MSSPQIARDDEEVRCISPQRLTSASSRVLTFPSPCVSLTPEARLRFLEQYDPVGYAMIVTALERLCALFPHGPQG